MQHVADRLAQKVRNPTNGSWWDFDFLCKASQPSLVAETALLKPQISEREEPIMFKQHLTGMFTFALLFLLAAVATQGQAPRTFVSSTGRMPTTARALRRAATSSVGMTQSQQVAKSWPWILQAMV